MDDLPWLRVLVLRSNKFDGSMSLLSQTKIPFPNLQVLDISQNRFVGSLPQRYFKNFIAMIEVNETNLSNDDTFRLYVEMRLTLKGNIPSSLGNISELESLDLSANKLDGEIPSDLTRLTFLAKLNLSMNNLVGQIPQSKQFSTFENDSYMGNEGLCGVPLMRKCNKENGQRMQPEEDDDKEEEYGFIDGFGWRSVVMGYGSGFIVGIGIGFIIIQKGRPRWLMEFFFGIGYNNKKKKRHNRATPTPTPAPTRRRT
ncbi:receptor like protein 22-like [Salvia miltiorrhiza]|uniref:receptor like protein 22-like n=1 Tax=Salvia miltiorrhiza TaxID=226208 RepID=UPI0025AC0355|nr:receptor like protein 22-like [Salvia miltiorrhiza]